MDTNIKNKIKSETRKYFECSNFNEVFYFFEQIIDYQIPDYNYQDFSYLMNNVLEELFLRNKLDKIYFKAFGNLIEKYMRILLYLIDNKKYNDLNDDKKGISQFAKNLGYKSKDIPRYENKKTFSIQEKTIISKIIDIKDFDSHYEQPLTEEDLVSERNQIMATYLLFTRENIESIKQIEDVKPVNTNIFDLHKLNPYIIDTCLQYKINFNEIDGIKGMDIICENDYIHDEYDNYFVLKKRTVPYIRDGLGGYDINYRCEHNSDTLRKYISVIQGKEEVNCIAEYDKTGLLKKYTKGNITTYINYDTNGSFDILRRMILKKHNNETEYNSIEYDEKNIEHLFFDEFGKIFRCKHFDEKSLDSNFNYDKNFLKSITKDNNSIIYRVKTFGYKLYIPTNSGKYTKVYNENGKLVCFGYRDLMNYVLY